MADKDDAIAKVATEYVTRIGLVIRAKLGHEPPWSTQLQRAVRGDGQSERCREAMASVPPLPR
jgi:hypothetical protein